MNDLKCIECRGDFKDPVILPCCSNSLCRECVLTKEKASKQSSGSDNEGKDSIDGGNPFTESQFECPFCYRVLVEAEISSLPSNQLLIKVGKQEEKKEEVIEDDKSEESEDGLCQRCSAEDQFLVCESCGGFALCEVCDDLIHSMGVYEKHVRLTLEESRAKAQQVEESMQGETEKPSPETLDMIHDLEQKDLSLKGKLNEIDVVLKEYSEEGESRVTEAYKQAKTDVESKFDTLSQLIATKKEQCLDQLELENKSKTTQLETSRTQIENLKSKISQVQALIQVGIENSKFTFETGNGFLQQRIKICEEKINADLTKRPYISSNFQKLTDTTPMTLFLGKIKLGNEPTSIPMEETPKKLEASPKQVRPATTAEMPDFNSRKSREKNEKGRHSNLRSSFHSSPYKQSNLRDKARPREKSTTRVIQHDRVS